MDNMPDMPDEADAPIIVPPPGLILRRAARTKIRKPSLPGDGGGHRFGSGRRTRATPQAESRTSSDLSSNEHISSSDHGDTSTETASRPRAFSNESMTSDGHDISQADSLIDEALIIDSYLYDEDEVPSTSLITSKPPLLSLSLPHDEPPPAESMEASTPAPVLHHPQPQRLTLSPPSEEPSRTPSPDASTLASSTEGTTVPSTVASGAPQKSPSPVPKKEKDRKGLFKWASDKGGKKNGKDKEREKEVQRVEKEKEGRFFGSLFGSKKKSDESPSFGSGREAATALLGQSKSSKQHVPSPSPQLPNVQGAYARYPIHVERAIYRLSHIKLANPRRPLYEQVLISNLMFWYLGVINKTQNPATAAAPQNQSVAATSNPDGEREAERRDSEEKLRAENDRLEREREIERDRELQLQQPQQKKESPRRGALTKTPSGSQGTRRIAEMPIKGPQYEMQHREMEQQYNSSSYGYGSSSPATLGGGSPRMQRQSGTPVHAPQPQPTSYMYPGYSGPGAADQQQFPSDNVQTIEWNSSPSSGVPSPPRTRSTPSPPPNGTPSPAAKAPHRSRSPPAQNHNRYVVNAPPAQNNHVQATRTATRSLSATAGSPPPTLPADGKTRKVTSAHAVMSTPPNRRPRAYAESPRTERGEEEDVPLAVWQQQRRK